MLIAELKKRVMTDQRNSRMAIVKKIETMGAGLKATPTIISQDINIVGNLSGGGQIEIEGSVNGNIKGGVVVIREKGFVEGEIDSDSVFIKGKFKGKIKARSINISSKAHISGQIEYQTLCVQDGASIDGEFKKFSVNYKIS